MLIVLVMDGADAQRMQLAGLRRGRALRDKIVSCIDAQEVLRAKGSHISTCG